ncbi:MAG TPA: class I SAM-dependent methyltransferase, partial [Candidatus Kryptobacter bacterium]|nr:class I SAM-dependent methyltransferase [Candidatus Kryptobacter bacterium]
ASNSQRRVVGIEKDERAAREAEKVLDEVISGDVENPNLPFPGETFDCIIFADILEHLKDPLLTLIFFKKYLRKDGYVICSIPNIRHYTVFIRLLTKGWKYDDYGLFDRTHLRFFSLQTMKELIQDAGLSVELIRAKVEASKKARLLNRLLFNKTEEFVAMQYLIKARNR